jgi:tetratricopeptide (TPR) repeat protein
VILHNGLLWVQDMGSRNGVFVNETRVQNQGQVNVGDTVRVGTHSFHIGLESFVSGAPPTPVPWAGPAATPMATIPPSPVAKKKLKKWPFILAFILAALLVAGVAILGAGAGKAKPSQETTADPVVDLLLSTSQDPAATKPTAAGGADAAGQVGLGDLVDAGKSASMADGKDWPPPPAGASSAELVDKGHQLWRAGRLHDALVAYHQARTLDKDCEICQRRIDRLNTEIEEAIQKQNDAGLMYFNSLQYDQAISAWETVLLLDPDPESEVYKQARENLEKAQASLKKQY